MRLLRVCVSLAATAVMASVAVAQPAAKPATSPPAPTPQAKPPVTNTRAATGPGTGTQTEDDAYVGAKGGGTKKTVQGAAAPAAGGRPARVPSAGTSPNTARDGGDDDLDDLEVERRTVQNANRPVLTTPAPRPGAGTSPNTGRAVGPTGPTPAPGTGAPPVPAPATKKP